MVVLVLILSVFIGMTDEALQTTEQRLLHHLLQNHNKLVRPVTNINQTVDAMFGMELIQIIDIDDRNQLITTKIWVRQSWMNNLMTWNSTEWENIEYLKVDGGDVWTPDVILYDNAESKHGGGVDRYKTQIILRPNGLHLWFSPAVFTSTCKINVKYFPFDRQICSMKFGSWTYDQSGINLQADNRAMITSQYINSSEWDVSMIERKVNGVKYGCCPRLYVDVTFQIHLQRKPSFYMFNVIIPCLVLSLTILFGFCFPPEAGERITLIITILLAMAVLMQVISGTMPINSDGMPKLALFYMVILIESAFSLGTTCIVLTLHYRSEESDIHPMPKWIRKFFIQTIARKLGYLRGKSANLERTSYDLVTETKNDSVNQVCVYKGIKEKRVEPKKGKGPGRKRSRTGFGRDWNLIALKGIQSDVHKFLSDVKEQQRKGEINEEWKILGKVLDKFFFVVFLLTIAISAVGILVPAYLHGD